MMRTIKLLIQITDDSNTCSYMNQVRLFPWWFCLPRPEWNRKDKWLEASWRTCWVRDDATPAPVLEVQGKEWNMALKVIWYQVIVMRPERVLDKLRPLSQQSVRSWRSLCRGCWLSMSVKNVPMIRFQLVWRAGCGQTKHVVLKHKPDPAHRTWSKFSVFLFSVYLLSIYR